MDEHMSILVAVIPKLSPLFLMAGLFFVYFSTITLMARLSAFLTCKLAVDKTYSGFGIAIIFDKTNQKIQFFNYLLENRLYEIKNYEGKKRTWSPLTLILDIPFPRYAFTFLDEEQPIFEVRLFRTNHKLVLTMFEKMKKNREEQTEAAKFEELKDAISKGQTTNITNNHSNQIQVNQSLKQTNNSTTQVHNNTYNVAPSEPQESSKASSSKKAKKNIDAMENKLRQDGFTHADAANDIKENKYKDAAELLRDTSMEKMGLPKGTKKVQVQMVEAIHRILGHREGDAKNVGYTFSSLKTNISTHLNPPDE